MNGLTRAQQEILDFVRESLSSGRSAPTLREIAAKFGFRSHRAAACHLEAIKRKGFLESDPSKARSLRLVNDAKRERRLEVVEIPLFGTIPAGFGAETEQEAEGCVTVDIETIGFRPTRTAFALRVIGDSMIGRHICSGDIVILEHGPEPRHGQIVAALIDGKSTLKTYVLKKGQAFLKAEHARYPDLIPSEELVIQGVFRALVRKVRE
jgi:repressor LexA